LSPQKVVFTGGEPMYRPDTFDIANAFQKIIRKNKSMHLCLISNGTLIDEKTSLKIAEFFDEVRISVDSFEKINDKIRGKGAFRGAIRAIRNLQKMDINPGVSVTVTSLNLPYLTNFLSFLFDDIYINDFHFSPFRPVGRGEKRPDLICSWRKAQIAVASFWQSRFGELKNLKSISAYTLIECQNCGVGSYINIHPDGAVYPCHVLSIPKFFLGNVRQKNLSCIVRDSTILKKLTSLNIGKIVDLEDNLKLLLEDAICMGEVYRIVPEMFDNIR
jgi:MoaA/NifB/PqqE/SkfB family radical SAM enzyme